MPPKTLEIRKAVGVHHTDTTDQTWDGPANKKNLKLDQAESYYRKAFAWQDPDGDVTNKSTYKFIHHQVDADGNIGAANTRACTSGIGVLNGGRGGTTIPAEDKEGVWNHLAAHLRDADIEPPALARSGELATRECRSLTLAELSIEMRADDAGEEKPKIVGYAALFNSPTVIRGWWDYTEIIRPGAFAKTLREADIRALVNHDPSQRLGRNKSGTLKLWEDDRGLAVEIDVPDTTVGRDLATDMRRGDINQMSFSFESVREEWDEETLTRTLIEVKLWDVSVVTYPAYPDTEASLRSISEALTGLLARARRGIALMPGDVQLLELTAEKLRSAEKAPTTQSAPAGNGHPEEVSAPDEVHPQTWGRSLPSTNPRLRTLELDVTLPEEKSA